MPGPGEYDNPTSLSSIGKYLLSSNKGGTNAKFDNAKRSTKFDEALREGMKVPGPGAYRGRSEFGLYEDEVLTKMSLRK